jgi:hypothetical protein
MGAIAVSATRKAKPTAASAIGNTETDRQPRNAERGAARIDHQVTVDWLAAHPEALSSYEDEWVAMVGQQVVGHGPTTTEALAEARANGHDDPLLVPVLPRDVLLIV